jgi:glycine cleavage system aminomethyltransferase T
MAYLPSEQATVGAELAVEYMGERYPVTVASADSTPLFDPDNSRVRS